MTLDVVARDGLVLLGCGKMGTALLTGWLAAGVPASSIWVIEPNPTDWLKGTGRLGRDLFDPRFAAFSQAIGEAGLRCAKEDYAWLIRLYWFSIEFGLMQEGHDGIGRQNLTGMTGERGKRFVCHHKARFKRIYV